MGRKKKNQATMEQLPSGATTDQDASGGLKTEIPEENGDAAKDTGQAGSDTPQAQEAEKNFETQRESIEDLDLREIQPFQAIPDYVEPTSSLYPIVVKTPTAITCIEGWSLVEQAKEAGKSSLTCHIHHVADASQEELAIRKVASRTKPQGGIAGYGAVDYFTVAAVAVCDRAAVCTGRVGKQQTIGQQQIGVAVAVYRTALLAC